MENEKMQINLAPGMEKATIKVIELDKENVLPVLEPLSQFEWHDWKRCRVLEKEKV